MGRMHAQTCRYVGAFVSRLACLLRSSFARETEMKPAAGGRERPGRSLHTHSVSLKHQIGVPRSILPSESGHRSSPRRARQRQHEHRTAMRHVVVHVAFFRTSCARGGGRASALKAGVESRPLSPSRTSRRRSSPTCTSRAPRGGPPRGARSRECCRFHVRWFFPGDRLNSTNEATKRRAAVRNHASVARSRIIMEGARAIDNRVHANAGNTGSCGVLSQQLACWFRSTRKLPVDSACPRSHTLSFSGGKPRGKSCRMRRRCQRLTTSWLMTIPTPSE